ncbi:putative Protein kinase domain containing protein [Blattamonas nauphoetae]|uniref:mitogen-activated protein kinase kinase n=1 Tax=Blattamonas nauphoetae TaxID=2049346 RepID=A0ABQ9XYU8_9EUKA|nr:putative Protein kinase domain containing protein [Blattamonas nauphoetae]
MNTLFSIVINLYYLASNTMVLQYFPQRVGFQVLFDTVLAVISKNEGVSLSKHFPSLLALSKDSNSRISEPVIATIGLITHRLSSPSEVELFLQSGILESLVSSLRTHRDARVRKAIVVALGEIGVGLKLAVVRNEARTDSKLEESPTPAPREKKQEERGGEREGDEEESENENDFSSFAKPVWSVSLSGQEVEALGRVGWEREDEGGTDFVSRCRRGVGIVREGLIGVIRGWGKEKRGEEEVKMKKEDEKDTTDENEGEEEWREEDDVGVKRVAGSVCGVVFGEVFSVSANWLIGFFDSTEEPFPDEHFLGQINSVPLFIPICFSLAQFLPGIVCVLSSLITESNQMLTCHTEKSRTSHGHISFGAGDEVVLEADMEARTCHLFVNSEQTKVFARGIPGSIKLAVTLTGEGDDTFLKTISSGGFGSVVEMIEDSTQKHFAGKIMQCITPKDKERIDREVNRLGKFGCDWIVKLKAIVSMDNSKVIAMELGGQSLAEIVKDHTSRGVLVPRDVVYRVMVDVSSALNLMHNHPSGATAHGDVKMENILLFPGGHFKLCDLGAAESEDVSSTRSVMSQLYVSPERMESETGRATCSSDVWALGIVLHWLLFGEPPFKSQNAARLFREIGSFNVSMIGSSCGGEERALLMRMLDPNPGSRVTSSQLCSFGVFRCLANTPSAVWRLKDDDEKGNLDKMKKELEMEQKARKRAEEKMMRMEAELKTEKSAHAHAVDKLKAELLVMKEKLTKSESERKENSARQEERTNHQSNHLQHNFPLFDKNSLYGDEENRKQIIGNHIYTCIVPIHGEENASKITGLILMLPYVHNVRIAENPNLLKQKICEG